MRNDRPAHAPSKLLSVIQVRTLFKQTAAYLAPLFKRNKRIKKLLNRIFIDDNLLRLFDNYDGANLEIIGDLETYNVIFVTKIPDQKAVSFSEMFFDSLQPHRRDYDEEEVLFRCGMVLDARFLEGAAKAFNIDINRLIKIDMFGRRRIWYYLYTRLLLRKASIKVMDDCVVIDI